MKTDTLVVHEIYKSIQGESSFAGWPCTFVRLTGCNLRCTYCDTPQAFKGGQRMARAEVLQQALAQNTPLVELTGGEPLLQPGSLPLMQALCDAGKTVLIETSGERDISGIDPRVHRIMDIKTPGSGEHLRNRAANIPLLTQRDEIKFVLTDRNDYEFARELITRERLSERVSNVLMSAAFGGLDTKSLVEWTLEDGLLVRVQLQLHKYIWSKDAQGV